MKPKMYEQFAVMNKEFLDLQRAIADIKRQLTNITYAVSQLCDDDGGGAGGVATAGVSSTFRPQQERLDEATSPPGYLAALSQSNEVYYCVKGGTQKVPPDVSLLTHADDGNTFGSVHDVAKPNAAHVLPQRSSDSPSCVPVANFLQTQRLICSPAHPTIADPEFTYTL